MLNRFEKRYTTIFLADSLSPSSLILLKRRTDTDVAPNLYTGLGGKIELGEDQLAGSVRELKEETGLTDLPLTEFSRQILNRERVFCFFWGIYRAEALPECNEGVLERVSVKNLYTKSLIPTVAIILKECERRNWDIQKLFTLYVEREDINNVFAHIDKQIIKEGLHF